MILASSFIRCCTCLQAPLLPVRTILSCTASCQSAGRGGEGRGFFSPADVNNPVLNQLQSLACGFGRLQRDALIGELLSHRQPVVSPEFP